MAAFDFEKWDQDFINPDSDEEQLLGQIKEALNQSPQNVEYLWRMSEMCIVMADICKKNKNKGEKAYVEEALTYAKKAIESDPSCCDAHTMYCCSMGRMADFVGIKERIKCGNEIQNHSKIAFGLNSTNSKKQIALYHMYGRFCYEVSSLSWVEKKVATTLFGEIPKTSYEEALASLEKADVLDPKWLMNKLWIIKVLIAQKKFAESIVWMDRALAIEAKAAEDVVSREELLELKSKYSKRHY